MMDRSAEEFVRFDQSQKVGEPQLGDVAAPTTSVVIIRGDD